MPDAFAVLCACASTKSGEILPEQAIRLELDLVERWEALGIVRETTPLPTIRCPRCREADDAWIAEGSEYGRPEEITDCCWADVTATSADGVVVGVTARCPRHGSVHKIVANSVRRWVVDLTAVAKTVASLLGSVGGIEELLPERLFRLGREAVERPRGVYLMRGLDWDDAAYVLDGAAADAGGLSRVSCVVIGGVGPDLAELPVSQVTLLRDLLVWTGEVFARRPLAGSDPPLPSASETVHRGKAKPAALLVIPTPTGSRWEDVRLRVGDHQLCVTIQGKRHWRHFTEAGFADGRRGPGSGVPNKLWAKLREFAESKPGFPPGEIPLVDGGAADVSSARGQLKEQMSRLRTALRALLPLLPNEELDPISTTSIVGGSAAGVGSRSARRTASTRRAERPTGYRLRCPIAPLPDPYFATPDGAGWSDLVLHRGDGDEVQVSVQRREAAGLPNAVGSVLGSSGGFVGTEPDGDPETFLLSEVVTSDDLQDLLNELLLRGALRAPKDARPVLALRRELARFFDLDPSCLVFDGPTESWLPRFQID